MDLYEVRKDEVNFASVILDSSTNGNILVSYDSAWKKNAEKMKTGAQRAYFMTDLYGRKLLNLSAIMGKARDSKALSKLLFNEDGKYIGNPDQKFICVFKNGRIDNVLPPTKAAKDKKKEKKDKKK